MAACLRVISDQFPEELVADILARLPPKSLMRFKCVQQSWNALFKTRSFVTEHLHASSLHKCLMIFEDSGDLSLHHHKLGMKQLMWDENTSMPPQDVPFPFTMDNVSYIFPYGPCNGIFLLSIYYKDHCGKLMLWNPETKEVKDIPPPDHYPPCYDLKTDSLSFGFGIDSNTGDYKVVSLLLRDNAISVEVYSLSTNSWTVFNDASVPVSNQIACYSTYANGVCYWITNSPNVVRGILCFDLSKNQFRELSVPINKHENESCSCHDHEIVAVDQPQEEDQAHLFYNLVGYDDIVEFNDSIAYILHYGVESQTQNNYRIEISILNDVVEESWTNVFNKEQVDMETKVVGFSNDGNGS